MTGKSEKSSFYLGRGNANVVNLIHYPAIINAG